MPLTFVRARKYRIEDNKIYNTETINTTHKKQTMQNTARPPECVHVVAAAPVCEGLAAVYRDSMIVRPDFDGGDVLSYSCRELLAKVV